MYFWCEFQQPHFTFMGNFKLVLSTPRKISNAQSYLPVNRSSKKESLLINILKTIINITAIVFTYTYIKNIIILMQITKCAIFHALM